MHRRSFLRLATVTVPWAGVGFSFPSRIWSQATQSTKFVAPPQQETAEITAAIEQVINLLKSGRASTSDILSNPSYLFLHEWPRFRLSIRDHASQGTLSMVAPNESGTRLGVKGTVLDSHGRGASARIYVYHTSAKGWYSDKAAHVSGNSGDQKHARLFGYLLSDESGHFEVKTIHPAGYPDSLLPEHIHVEIESLGNAGQTMITEALFAGDPRLTPEARARSQQERFVICDVKQKSDGTQEISADFRTGGEKP
jgi:protocatechuate 3,4-dioxygenase beta subunit